MKWLSLWKTSGERGGEETQHRTSPQLGYRLFFAAVGGEGEKKDLRPVTLSLSHLMPKRKKGEKVGGPGKLRGDR